MSVAGASRPRLALACAGALLALGLPMAARAEPACAASVSPAESQRWAPPLDRAVVFQASDLSLREALDRLAAAARIRISYSAELLPLDRRVCLSRASRTLGDALAELLRETPVEAVVASADHVVLALRRRAATEESPAAELGRTVELDRVVVTGTAEGGPRRSLAVAPDFIGAEQLERAGTAPLTRVLSASSAGVWAWEQPPTRLMARYGSLRGASSFGASHPKVFIDGIEVANPLLAVQISPDAVERIEVIRGPQGAALYGTDAISGVVNIVTRHEGTDGGAPWLRVRSGLGASGSDFGSGAALAQEHALALRAGDRLRSAGLDVGVGTLGEFVPQGASQYLLASGNARRIGPRSIVTGTARFYAAAAGAAANPLLPDDPRVAPAGPRRMRQYTLGASARLAWNPVWTHSLVVGMDGGRISGVTDEEGPLLPGAGETLAGASAGGADRGTLRLSSVGHVLDGARTDLTLSFAAEHSVLREEASLASNLVPHASRAVDPWVTWTRTTGVVGQANAGWKDRLFLTGGLRVEGTLGLAGIYRYSALPVLGGAWVTDLGGATLKVRAAYGKGIRPARTPGRAQPWTGAYGLPGTGLAPEEQSGVEGGFDLSFGRAFSLQVTAYDQLASGLIQRVLLPWEGAFGQDHAPSALQNVGEISNRGWEMQGAAALGALSLTGAFSLVDSRVRTVAAGYTGDLRAGDRMLEVPARTATLTAAWTGARWMGSLTAYRAFDWVNYDRLALARDVAAAPPAAPEPTGAELRAYWREYPGVTRVNAMAAMDVRGGLVLVLSGENLLDHQRGEPDNLTLVPGRTLTLGIRAEF